MNIGSARLPKRADVLVVGGGRRGSDAGFCLASPSIMAGALEKANDMAGA